ncbi:MAG: sugar phosphate isomerase/epimerase [Clostridia bacterium]|nr:sugar phosphate isomerase/epimerase [Clostridia bacterium]
MKLGIHAYAWCTEWSNEQLDLIDRAKQLGMDFIEIPLMVLNKYDASAVRERLEKLDFDAVFSTVLTSETDITSEDENIRKNGVDYLKKCVRAVHDTGKTNFSGVIYSQHIKSIDHRPTEQEYMFSADSLREVAVYAKQFNVMIGLEPVNRYETFLVNTASQAKMLKEMIGMDNIRIHLDTYHMNIEEKSFYEATRLVGDDLMHYHLCENDRGIPGTGLVNWDDIFKALAEMNYNGYAALESFVDCTDNMSTWVWRQLAENGDTLVTEGVAFIRKMMKKHGLS